MYFYDTCSLINDQEAAFKEPFVIADITLYELEEIKSSKVKDEELKAKVRKLLYLLDRNKDKYEIFAWTPEFSLLSEYYDKNDSRIVASALEYSEKEPILFRTDDLACAFIARNVGLDVVTQLPHEEEYTGFKKIIFNNEDETVEFYSTMIDGQNHYNLLPNQYLFIYVKDKLIDKQKWNGQYYETVSFPCFESKALGKIKPKDEFQQAAMDSLKNNKLTVLRGYAGSGKSYLAMGYLMDRLEHGIIDKIIIFCNTVATTGAAKLGFYPGSRDEKLMDSQIGNFLASKLGSMSAVEQMIDQERLVLLPLSDLRGYDTTGMNAGVYITEAQNMDIELMRLALQRIGEDSICIIDGDDEAQVDMAQYSGSRNGMKRLSKIFRGQDFYGEIKLQTIRRSRIADLAQQM